MGREEPGEKFFLAAFWHSGHDLHQALVSLEIPGQVNNLGMVAAVFL